MRRLVATVATAVVALCVMTTGVEGQQDWPSSGSSVGGLEWIVGGSVPVSGLGSFGSYDIFLDAWPMVGVSIASDEDEDDRFRTRFEITAVPSVAMRRAPDRDASEKCEDCTADSFRLSVINSRFLFDVTFPFVAGTSAYVTGGPVVRFQLSDPEECPSSAGEECALPQFGRARLDPGMVAGAGWEPNDSLIDAIQLTGRMSFYGRGERPEAAPASWLPELDLSIRFSIPR